MVLLDFIAFLMVFDNILSKNVILTGSHTEKFRSVRPVFHKIQLLLVWNSYLMSLELATYMGRQDPNPQKGQKMLGPSPVPPLSQG